VTAPDSAEVRLARIETKLDAMLARFTEGEARTQTNHVDHETRIRALERAKWAATGFAAAGGGTLGAVLSQLLGG
jgi:hypothetical protein